MGRHVLAVVGPRLVVLGVVAGYLSDQAVGSALLEAPTGDAGDVLAQGLPAHGSAGWLVERHGCWTGEAPAPASMPRHVVVTVDGDPTYGGPRLVGRALAEVFEDADTGLTVHAFCE